MVTKYIWLLQYEQTLECSSSLIELVIVTITIIFIIIITIIIIIIITIIIVIIIIIIIIIVIIIIIIIIFIVIIIIFLITVIITAISAVLNLFLITIFARDSFLDYVILLGLSMKAQKETSFRNHWIHFSNKEPLCKEFTC